MVSRKHNCRISIARHATHHCGKILFPFMKSRTVLLFTSWSKRSRVRSSSVGPDAAFNRLDDDCDLLFAVMCRTENASALPMSSSTARTANTAAKTPRIRGYCGV